MRAFPRSIAAAALAWCGLALAPFRPAAAPAADPLAGLPLFFEPSQQPGESPSAFRARGGLYQFQIGPAEACLALRRITTSAFSSPLERDLLVAPRPAETRSIRLRFLGADPSARLAGEGELTGKINYLIGADPRQWRKQVPTYSRVRVRALYPGIDLVYYGNQQQLEYDFAIAPHANPAPIAMRFDGTDKLTVSPDGELIIGLGADEIRQPAPSIYQVVAGTRKKISGGYRLVDSRTATFSLGEYDPDLPLIIDPLLAYSSYFGGNFGDIILAIKINPADSSVYIAGQTLSTSFAFTPPPGAFQPGFAGGTINGDAFVARLDATLTNLIYFTYLGGSGNDGGLDLAIDNAGNAYVTGFTDSTNFPTANPAFQHIGGTFDSNFKAFPTDAFVSELDPLGSSLIYSTYLGGSDADVGGGIAVDPGGNAYVTGYTASTNFPTTNALVFHLAGTPYTQLNRLGGNRDAFVAKFSPSGSNLVYSTYLGGTNNDEGQAIIADAAGFAYVTGYTSSTNFPVTNTLPNGTLLNGVTNRPGALDGFLAKIEPGGVILDSSSYFGGTNSDAGFRIAMDPSGALYVTGSTSSGDYPNSATNVPGLSVGVTNSSFNTDGFLTKFRYTGNIPSIEYSALFGGKKDDTGWAVAVDGASNAYVIGITASSNFPAFNTNGFLQGTSSGSNDLFVTVFNANASALLYSVYLGGRGDDYGYGIAVDGAGNAYIAGRTLSTNFPVVNALQSSRSGLNDGILARIASGAFPLLQTFRVGSELFVRWPAFAPEYHLESNALLGTAGWTFLSAAPPPTNGWHTVHIDATNANAFFRLSK